MELFNWFVLAIACVTTRKTVRGHDESSDPSQHERSLGKANWDCLDAYWDLWQNETLISSADTILNYTTFDMCDASNPCFLQRFFPSRARYEFTKVCEENNGSVQYHSFNTTCKIFEHGEPAGRILLVFDDLPDCVPVSECDMEVFSAQFDQTTFAYAMAFERQFRSEGLGSVRRRAETEGSSTSTQGPGYLFAIVGIAIIWHAISQWIFWR
jgi:hypothetical protein